MSLKRQLLLFFCAIACMSAATGMHDSIFTNFLSDTFRLSAEARGQLEFPRELPGFLTVLLSGLLCMIPITRVGVIGEFCFAMGMIGLGVFGTSYPLMIGAMLMGSAGLHLVQPVGSSIILGLSNDNERGKRMGQTAAVTTLATAIGAGSVFLVLGRLPHPYRIGFLAAALLGMAAAVFYARMHVPHLHQKRARFVVRKRYWLYYLLEFLFGTRKQIFITFGPWVLVKIYGLSHTNIAALLMTSALIGMVVKPMAGGAIDRFGERAMMITDGVVLSVVCVGYGYATHFAGPGKAALLIACGCFIMDDMLFALGNARAVYLSRMTPDPQELNSSLAFGISVNHIASMSIPMVAGAIWEHFGYERVFMAASIFALGCATVSMMVPCKAVLRALSARTEQAEAPAANTD
jgi:MFS family permease